MTETNNMGSLPAEAQVKAGYKHTKLGWIPEDWDTLPFTKLANLKHGFQFRDEHFSESGVGVVKIGSLIDGKGIKTADMTFVPEESLENFKNFILNKGDILMALTGGTLGKVAVMDQDITLLQNYRVGNFIPLKNSTRNYIYHLLQSFFVQQRVKNLVNEAAQPNFGKQDFDKIKIPLPPLPEQQKIARILSTWDRVIDKTGQLIAKKQEQKRGLMQQLLTGKKRFSAFVTLGSATSANKPEPNTWKIKETMLGLIPEDWEEITFARIADKKVKWSITGGPFGSDLKSDDFTESGVRILQLQNLGDGQFLDSYKIYTSEEKADKLLACNIYPGEVILSKMGDPVARACIIPNSESRFLMASDGIRLVPDKSQFNSRFVLEYINYSVFRKLAIRHSTGSTRQRIGLSDLKKLPFIQPKLPEQQKIASVLSTADQEIEKLQKQLDKLKEQKKGLMQVLLTGEIRVHPVK